MSQTHVMKFVHKGRTHPENKGIRTFPHHTYGVSRQSPDHFKQTHTLINHGYHYDHQHKPNFEYHSQKKSFVMTHQHPYQVQIDKEDHIHHTLHLNPHRFHLKKGRLTQFWDKNGWINGVSPVAGFQRSEKSRSFNNRDRDEKIKNQKQKVQYQSHIIKKTHVHPSYYQTLETMMSQRVRIRIRRNREADSQLPLAQRTFSQMKVGELEGGNIKTKMAQTTKQWYPTLKEKKMSRDLSFKEEKVIKAQKKFDLGTDNLEEWQRKTCNSKWCYKEQKEDLFDSLETQQIL